jgi:predicted RNA binding protein YcfA (HicA-like mRNA interferase family)
MKPQIWDQLKNKTADELISALERDGWILEGGKGNSVRVYIKELNLVAIHYHPHKNYGAKMLSDLIEKTGWTEQDLKRLKLIK